MLGNALVENARRTDPPGFQRTLDARLPAPAASPDVMAIAARTPSLYRACLERGGEYYFIGDGLDLYGIPFTNGHL